MNADHRRELIASDEYCHLVIVDTAGAFAAYCECSVSRAEWQGSNARIGWIDYVGTDPAQRGRGLGRAVLLAGLARLQAWGASTAMLITASDNEPANRLYIATGFTRAEAAESARYEQRVLPIPEPDIRPISAAETHALRHAVLHPHRGIESEDCPADHAPDSLHLGAFRDGELAGIVSVSRAPFPGAPERAAWQLRAMATAPSARRQGYGAALVRACIAHVAAHGGGILWCNGRTGVTAFYESLGLRRWGDEFQVPFTGPHYVLWQEVDTVGVVAKSLDRTRAVW